jgi:hypothetical protein
MQSTTFSSNQIELALYQPEDAKGNPGQLQPGNVPTSVSDTPAVCTVTVDPTGLIATLTAVAAGSANITISGINALGTTISTVYQVVITPTVDAATGFNITFQTPTTPAAA